MKKFRKIGVLICASLLLVLTANTASAQMLKMSSQWTENTPGGQVDVWWANEIEKRTNGEVKIKIFWKVH